MTNFHKWLSSQMYQTAIVILPKDEELVLDVPEDMQETHQEEKDIPCNHCPAGKTEMWVYTKNLNFTVRNGDIFEASNIGNFEEGELFELGRLVEQGVIKPRYRRNEKQELEQLQENGEWTTDF